MCDVNAPSRQWLLPRSYDLGLGFLKRRRLSGLISHTATVTSGFEVQHKDSY